MKARWWLLMAAAMMLLPSAAHAQKKKPKGTAATPATAPAPTPAPPPAAPANGGEIELDAPATPPPGGDQTRRAARHCSSGCASDRRRRGRGRDDGRRRRPLRRHLRDRPLGLPEGRRHRQGGEAPPQELEVYAVEQIYALRRHRLELNPYWGFTLNDQFVSHPGPGLDLKYYVTNVLAIGLNGNWYGGLNGDSDFNFENRRAAHISVPLNEYQWGANLNFTYVPVYGKFAGFNEFIFSYDLYLRRRRRRDLDSPDLRHRPRQPDLPVPAEARRRSRDRSPHLPESLVRRDARECATTSTTRSSRTRASSGNPPPRRSPKAATSATPATLRRPRRLVRRKQADEQRAGADRAHHLLAL